VRKMQFIRLLIPTKLTITAFIIVLFSATVGAETISVSGVVLDKATGEPISDAIIEVISSDISRLMSDQDGRYNFYLPDGTSSVKFKVTKSGYEPHLDIFEARLKLVADFQLNKIGSSNQVRISNINISPGLRISGTVQGLTDAQRNQYKVIVYVLTDKWYIHPFAENRDGRGYASIQAGGNWKIQTVWRGYQSYKVAFLVVDKSYLPPPTVSLTEGNPSGLDADQMILTKINPHYYLIQESPEGI
jgi:hypothetical protein